MKKEDAIVVLGSGVNADGSITVIGKERVDKGVKLFRLGISDLIIMSGGYSSKLSKKPVKSEAEAMKDYALSLGMPKDKILPEKLSRNTIGNAYFVKKILEVNGWRDIIVVTSDFHVERSRYIFSKVLGSHYNIEFAGAESNIPEELREMVRGSEKERMKRAAALLGSDADIEKTLLQIDLLSPTN